MSMIGSTRECGSNVRMSSTIDMYMASYMAVGVEQGVGVASLVCSTSSLLQEVAPLLERSVPFSQAAVRRQLQDPAHSAPKEINGHTP